MGYGIFFQFCRPAFFAIFSAPMGPKLNFKKPTDS